MESKNSPKSTGQRGKKETAAAVSERQEELDILRSILKEGETIVSLVAKDRVNMRHKLLGVGEKVDIYCAVLNAQSTTLVVENVEVLGVGAQVDHVPLGKHGFSVIVSLVEQTALTSAQETGTLEWEYNKKWLQKWRSQFAPDLAPRPDREQAVEQP